LFTWHFDQRALRNVTYFMLLLVSDGFKENPPSPSPPETEGLGERRAPQSICLLPRSYEGAQGVQYQGHVRGQGRFKPHPLTRAGVHDPQRPGMEHLSADPLKDLLQVL
jgi:hypothetical protein